MCLRLKVTHVQLNEVIYAESEAVQDRISPDADETSQIAHTANSKSAGLKAIQGALHNVITLCKVFARLLLLFPNAVIVILGRSTSKLNAMKQ